MKRVGNLIWGLVLIILGIIFGLNALDITDINIFFKGWWTLFIIIPSFVGIFKDNEKTGSIIGLIIGIVLLLCAQNVIGFDIVWKLLLPTILIVFGLSFIFKDFINNKVRDEIRKVNKNDSKEYCSTFSGQKIDYEKETFDGCNLSAVFGGIELDLRNSILKEDAVINASAIFGGIDIMLPKDVNVKIVSNSIFGGVDDHNKKRNDANKITIYINAKCVFGGVDIK